MNRTISVPIRTNKIDLKTFQLTPYNCFTRVVLRLFKCFKCVEVDYHLGEVSAIYQCFLWIGWPRRFFRYGYTGSDLNRISLDLECLTNWICHIFFYLLFVGSFRITFGKKKFCFFLGNLNIRKR